MFLERLEELKKLNFPSGSYLIWGSGPLAIRNLRGAKDIDIIVRKELWEDLSQQYFIEGSKNNLIRIGNVEVWKDCMNLYPSKLKNRFFPASASPSLNPSPSLLSNGIGAASMDLNLGR